MRSSDQLMSKSVLVLCICILLCLFSYAIMATAPSKPCWSCNGSGSEKSICTNCGGTGKAGGTQCYPCRGRGCMACLVCQGTGRLPD